jgi:hypothetical protein
MSVPQPACTSCGKNFTTDVLRAVACKHCGTVLAHHRRAAEQVAVIHEMMADRNGNGIPDAYEGLVANAQSNAALHVQANMMGMPQASPYAASGASYGAPPAGGFGAAPPVAMGPPPYAMQADASANAVGKAVAGATIAMIVVVVLVALVLMVGGFFAFFLLRG